jgi:polyphosphate kinase
MIEVDSKKKLNMHLEQSPDKILDDIQRLYWNNKPNSTAFGEYITRTGQREDLPGKRKATNKDQKVFVQKYFEEEVRVNTCP